jgi:hypothetical protein
MENEMSPSPTLREINEQNRLFWEEQNELRDQRLADEDFRETAFARLSDEQARRVPLKSQLTLERALADAERDKKRILSQQARKGGRAKKSDALQQAIESLVRLYPDITEAKVKDMLTRERYPGLIDDVDEDTIWFVQPDGSEEGRLKKAPISGLKHRLSRAKRALKSR